VWVASDAVGFGLRIGRVGWVGSDAVWIGIRRKVRGYGWVGKGRVGLGRRMGPKWEESRGATHPPKRVSRASRGASPAASLSTNRVAEIYRTGAVK
jgi:hypothetical protein